MIDTVVIGFPIEPVKRQLEPWHVTITKQSPQKNGHKKLHTKFQTWLEYDSGKIHVTYYPQDMLNRPNPVILYEMSLPRLVYGNNLVLLEDPSLAIKKANQIIEQNPIVPRVDLNCGAVYRIDLCYNFQVGEFVSEWIRQLSKLEYPRRKTKPYYPSDGVRYHSGKATLTFYDKEEKSHNAKAYGILRMEATWKGRTQIGKLVGLPEARLGDFPIHLILSILDSELKKLGIKDREPIDPMASQTALIKQYGPEQGTRLFGFLCSSQQARKKDLLALGMSKQTISRNRKQIQEAGLSFGIAEEGHLLPSLVIQPQSTVERDHIPMRLAKPFIPYLQNE